MLSRELPRLDPLTGLPPGRRLAASALRAGSNNSTSGTSSMPRDFNAALTFTATFSLDCAASWLRRLLRSCLPSSLCRLLN